MECGDVRIGLDIEPARLVTARLVNILARLVIQTSQQTSSARLAKNLEKLIWLASQIIKTHIERL